MSDDKPAQQASSLPARERLLPAYLSTSYIVEHGGERLSARVGASSPAIDGLLAASGATSGVFITAANPLSHPRDAEENERANQELRDALLAEGWRILPHDGIGESGVPEGAWREPGFFVLDLPDEAAVALALSFGQYAIVRYRVGGVAELLFTRLADMPHDG